MSKCQQLLNYANTYRNVYIQYHASNMVLHSCSDVAYLVAPKARSCIAPYNYLSNHPSKTRKPTLNWPILIECKILRNVVSSAVEAETKGLCHAAQSSMTIRTFLLNLGHPQPSTLLKTDDSTAIVLYIKTYNKRNRNHGTCSSTGSGTLVQHLLRIWENQPCRLLHKALTNITS